MLPAGTKPRTSHHRSPEGEKRGKRKRSTFFFERTREDYCQSFEHWNRFKGNVGETCQRRGGAHTISNSTELRPVYSLPLTDTERGIISSPPPPSPAILTSM